MVKQASTMASKGGIARAKSMTAAERSAVAKKAATERWAQERGIPKVTHEGELHIGDLVLSCAVLEDGSRVFSERQMGTALGWVRSGSQFAAKRDAPDGARLPIFMLSKHVLPYVSDQLAMELSQPVMYRGRKGGKLGHGIKASLLPDICEAWLRAGDSGELPVFLQHVVDKSQILIRGLARVGVIALVDEATGYQADRARDELQRLLEAFVAEEMRPWVKLFPDEFFRQTYRLQGWEYEPGVTQGPRYVGKLINKYVYGVLPPVVIEELRARNPAINGRRRHKHHQFLTEDIGHPALDRHIASVTALMRASVNKHMFEQLFTSAFPLPGTQGRLQLPSVSYTEDE